MENRPSNDTQSNEKPCVRIDITQSGPRVGATSIAALIAMKLKEALPGLEIKVVSAEGDFAGRYEAMKEDLTATIDIPAQIVLIHDHCNASFHQDGEWPSKTVVVIPADSSST